METGSLLGIWTGTAHNSNGWDMKITLSILQPVEIGTTLGVFDIPLIPCSGSFRVIDIHDEIIELRAENLRGECGEAISDSLELLPDGTLLYVSKGDGWEARGVLQRAMDDTLLSYKDSKSTMISTKYATILFDWGDTVMRDDPASTIPMVEWPTVEIIEGIETVLEYLHTSGRRIVLATSAAISDEPQIWAALRRGGLDRYFSRIYCFKNTHLPKGEEFYRHILNDLGLQASDVLMVGDSFEKDVLAANNVGVFAVWFNTRSDERRSSGLHSTVHSMQELRAFFTSLDQK